MLAKRKLSGIRLYAFELSVVLLGMVVRVACGDARTGGSAAAAAGRRD
jgi:hypothetical protein